jgi:hypothetical protein
VTTVVDDCSFIGDLFVTTLESEEKRVDNKYLGSFFKNIVVISSKKREYEILLNMFAFSYTFFFLSLAT